MSILALDTSWSDPVTLTQDEIFQAHRGEAYLTLEDTAPTEITDGIKLLGNDRGFVAVAGSKVRWASPTPSTTRLYRGPAGVLA